MALLWMDAEGNGISVAETAAVSRRRIEDADRDDEHFVEFTVDGGTQEDSWRTIYIDRDCIYAVEQGAGVDSD